MDIEKFITQLEDVFEKDASSITASDTFRDYDEWDSLSVLSLVAMLEDEYGVIIPRDKFDGIKTVQGLFDHVKNNQ